MRGQKSTIAFWGRRSLTLCINTGLLLILAIRSLAAGEVIAPNITARYDVPIGGTFFFFYTDYVSYSFEADWDTVQHPNAYCLYSVYLFADYYDSQDNLILRRTWNILSGQVNEAPVRINVSNRLVGWSRLTVTANRPPNAGSVRYFYQLSAGVRDVITLDSKQVNSNDNEITFNQ